MPNITNKKSKSLLLFLIVLTVSLLDILSSNLSQFSRTYLNSDYCISDALFELFTPVTK